MPQNTKQRVFGEPPRFPLSLRSLLLRDSVLSVKFSFLPIFDIVPKGDSLLRCPPDSLVIKLLLLSSTSRDKRTQPNRTAKRRTSPALLPSPRGQLEFFLTLVSPVSNRFLIQVCAPRRNCHPVSTGFVARTVWV